MWRTSPLHPFFGAEITGIKVGADLDPDLGAAVLDEVARAGVVLLREQSLDHSSLATFAASLGSNEVPHATITGKEGGVFRLSNLDPQGAILPPEDKMIQLMLANEFWHTDHTFVRPRASYSMLYGRTIPPVGGETQLCDTRRAYERLPPTEQDWLRTLTASHSVLHSRKLTGFDDWTEAELEAYGVPIERPVVHIHEESGRPALCVASYICRFSGMDEQASAELLNKLIEHATQPEEVYTHQWRPGDLLIWDDRCTMHRAMPYDYRRHGREMLIPPRLLDLADKSPVEASHDSLV